VYSGRMTLKSPGWGYALRSLLSIIVTGGVRGRRSAKCFEEASTGIDPVGSAMQLGNSVNL
jgi:hypothetical protein